MVIDTQIAIKTAELLLQVNAIKLNPDHPFVWSSGWNSPIYCDNRITLSFPEVRTFIKESLCHLIQNKFQDAEMIAGVATAGIAHGALIADELDMPFCYVRSTPKSHGLTNQIEGMILENQKTVVIEDLISTGGSSLSVVDALRKVNANVMGLAAIFDYGFQTAEINFAHSNCSFFTLTNYEVLINTAVNKGFIAESQLESLKQWRLNPSTWKK